jgi:hypothetical protein
VENPKITILPPADKHAYDKSIKKRQRMNRKARKKLPPDQQPPQPKFTKQCQNCYMLKQCKHPGKPWKYNRPCKCYLIYIDQDYCGQREAPFTILGCDKNCIPEDQNVFLQEIPATKTDIISLFFTHKLTITQISDMFYKSHQYISKIVRAEIARKAKKHPKPYHIYKG